MVEFFIYCDRQCWFKGSKRRSCKSNILMTKRVSTENARYISKFKRKRKNHPTCLFNTIIFVTWPSVSINTDRHLSLLLLHDMSSKYEGGGEALSDKSDDKTVWRVESSRPADIRLIGSLSSNPYLNLGVNYICKIHIEDTKYLRVQDT